MSKKISGIIAIALGVAIIIIGIVAMTSAPGGEYHSTSYQYIRSAEFGADFYTYMYDASYSIVQQLNSIDRGFSDLLAAQAKTQESIHNVGGLLMICFGLGVAALGVTQFGGTDAAVVVTAAAPVQTVEPVAAAPAAVPAATQSDKLPAWKRVELEREAQAKAEAEAKPELPEAVSPYGKELQYALQFETDEGLRAQLLRTAQKEEFADHRAELQELVDTVPLPQLRLAVQDLLQKNL